MDDLSRDIDGWQLAAMSVGALAAAVAALVLFQLVPTALQTLIHDSADESAWWYRLVVGTAMSLGAVVGFTRTYALVARYGAKLERQGRRQVTALLVGTVPWVGFALWLWWETG